MNFVSIRERIVDTNVVSDVTRTRLKLLHVWSYEFYDTMVSTEYLQRHSINGL